MAKSRSHKSAHTENELDPALQQKLDEVINEGILDSVLPFVCPSVGSNTDCTGHHNASSHSSSRKHATPKPAIVNTQPDPEPVPSGKKLHNTPEKQVTISAPKHIRKKASGQGSSITMEKHSE